MPAPPCPRGSRGGTRKTELSSHPSWKKTERPVLCPPGPHESLNNALDRHTPEPDDTRARAASPTAAAQRPQAGGGHPSRRRALAAAPRPAGSACRSRLLHQVLKGSYNAPEAGPLRRVLGQAAALQREVAVYAVEDPPPGCQHLLQDLTKRPDVLRGSAGREDGRAAAVARAQGRTLRAGSSCSGCGGCRPSIPEGRCFTRRLASAISCKNSTGSLVGNAGRLGQGAPTASQEAPAYRPSNSGGVQRGALSPRLRRLKSATLMRRSRVSCRD